MSIVPEAAMVDIDALRIDLGLGSAIVAFQVKGTESDRILSYKIYSLESHLGCCEPLRGELV
jgi:hypothetical protein